MLVWLLFNALVGLAWIALAWGLQRTKKLTPQVVHTLWLLVMLRLVAPPLPEGSWVFGTGSAQAPPPALIESGTPAYQREIVAWLSDSFGNNWSNHLMTLLLVVWGLGCVHVIVREVRRDRRLRRALDQGVPVDGVLRARLEDVARRIHLTAALPDVRVVRGIDSPFLWSPLLAPGRRPICILPTHAQDLPDSVLAHELVHLKRRDHWVAWAEFAALAICWWNPLVHYVRRQLQVAAELACDGEVLDHYPEERRVYATALVETLERDCAVEWRTPALGTARAVGWDPQELKGRMERILDSRPRRGRFRGLRLLAGLCVLSSLPGLAAPGLDQFEDWLPSIPNELSESRASEMLRLAEEQLAANPEDGAAVSNYGRALIALGRFLEAAEAYERQIELGHRVANGSYNQACAYALGGEPEAGLASLKRALGLGIPVEFAQHDKDLDSLRSLPGFDALVAP